MLMATIDTLERPAALLRGRRLEYFTIAWNTFTVHDPQTTKELGVERDDDR